MLDGSTRRVVSMWFPRLASDRVLRARPTAGPFALTLKQDNTERLYCLTPAAEALGLHRGMPFADARAFCPDLASAPAEPGRDARFLAMLCRWATRYCPWTGLEGRDGLVLDVTGSAHLWGGEAAMLAEMRARLTRAGLSVRLGLADTRGAAWALAHFGPVPEDDTTDAMAAHIARPGATLDAIGPLPVAGLRLDPDMSAGLERLGLRRIGELAAAPRPPLARRFGPGLMRRLDQATGAQAEQISPLPEPPHYGVRLTLPEPIGLTADVMAGTSRLLDQLCARLKAREAGARVLQLTLRRIDQGSQQVELRLASPMRDPARILPLFERGVDGIEAGFGIDQMRLEAVRVEPLPVQQLNTPVGTRTDRLDELVTRIGTRIGLEQVQRFLPADSHIPERSHLIAPAAFAPAEGGWSSPAPRPLRLFPPEPLIPTDAPARMAAAPASGTMDAAASGGREGRAPGAMWDTASGAEQETASRAGRDGTAPVAPVSAAPVLPQVAMPAAALRVAAGPLPAGPAQPPHPSSFSTPSPVPAPAPISSLAAAPASPAAAAMAADAGAALSSMEPGHATVVDPRAADASGGAPAPASRTATRPPERFRWRRMPLATLRAAGPERLAPEWWFDDPQWRTGVRDYWRVETRQGRRLWLFHTPQAPDWYVHGEFA